MKNEIETMQAWRGANALSWSGRTGHDRSMAQQVEPLTNPDARTSASLRLATPEVVIPSDPALIERPTVFAVRELDFYYGAYQALRNVDIEIRGNEVTALIGPSGCGKSTFLRCLNRMNDLVPGARVDGVIAYH